MKLNDKRKNEEMKNKTNNKNIILKILFIVFSIFLVVPSIIYIIKNGTIMNFKIYYNFFLNNEINKVIPAITFLVLFICISIVYIILVKRKDSFKNLKQIMIFTSIIGIIFIFMMPWTSSDIFYYMGVGELDGIYNQNPYYTTVKDYYTENKENINDELLEKGAENGWSDTTVVYGPVAQLIFKICSTLSFKNIDIAIFLFKFINLLALLLSIYLIYKITNKQIFTKIFALNPFIFIEYIGNVHNDIILVLFVLISLYFLLKKKRIIPSIVFLGIATGIKYFTILLLPVYIIYCFRKEEKLGKRFVKCIQYGLLFILILMVEYIIYFRDFSILTAMFVQTEKYSKSIYSSAFVVMPNILKPLKFTLYIVFFIYYFKFCIDLLTTKEIRWNHIIRKYNIALILFLLILGTFQQWYIIWLFASIMWQKPNMIRNIVGISLISELANSIYMFNKESYIYDIYFVEAIVIMLLIWQIITNKIKINRNKQKVIKKGEN